MGRKNWTISTVVRNPQRIRHALRVLKKFEGDTWGYTFQKSFLNALRKEDIYKGKKKLKDPAGFGRGWWSSIGTFFGFSYVDKKGKIRLTPAGNLLIETQRPNELFLRQLLKWQIPNPQHNEGKAGYKGFNILPFVATLEIIKDIGGLTKDEIGLFLLTLRDMNAIERNKRAILTFRKACRKIKSVEQKLEFMKEILKKKGYEKNLDNWINTLAKDYADSLIRYFRYSDLLTVRHNMLAIHRDKVNEVKKILSSVPHTLKPYESSEEWYSYFGNPNIPVLPFDNITDLKEKIDRLERERALLEKKISEISIPPLEGMNKIINMYDRILTKDIIEPPKDYTWFEWNTKRAFEQIGGFRVEWNGTCDKEGNPIGHAGAGVPDILAHTPNYTLVIEVTLKTGTTQWISEHSSVPEHVEAIAQKVAHKVHGLFIAPVISLRTYRTFWGLVREQESVPIIPLSLIEFKSILKFHTNVRGLAPSEIISLLQRFEIKIEDTPNSLEWKKEFPNIIENWMSTIKHKKKVFPQMLSIYRYFYGEKKKYKEDIELSFGTIWVNLKDTGLFENRVELKNTLNLMAALNLLRKNGTYIRAPVDEFEFTVKRFADFLEHYR